VVTFKKDATKPRATALVAKSVTLGSQARQIKRATTAKMCRISAVSVLATNMTALSGATFVKMDMAFQLTIRHASVVPTTMQRAVIRMRLEMK
jgi:hypothetical protein